MRWKPRPIRKLAAAGLLALCALALAAVNHAQAAPPAPIDIPVTQPDGSQIIVRQWGDEWQHGLQDLDGYTLVEEPGGFLVYARRQADGTLAPALAGEQPLIAGQDAPKLAGLAPFERPDAVETRQVTLNSTGAIGPQALDPAPPAQSRGERSLLVILVQFQDQAAHPDNTPAAFKQQFFGAASSVRDYYLKASNNQLTFKPAQEASGAQNDGIAGWYTLGINHPNPQQGEPLEIISENLARHALYAARNHIDFAAYDTDNDGYVTSKELMVVIVAAGFEGAYPPDEPNIWAHQMDLDFNPQQLDGKFVGSNSPDGDYGGYVLMGERHGTHIAQIGIMAHEIGHLLAWPDLYGTDLQVWEGVGTWSVMGSGIWNAMLLPGDTPALPDAWSRWYQGWLTPTYAVSGAPFTTISSASLSPFALLIGPNDNNVDWKFRQSSGSGEYWLVEKRQLYGYDAGLYGCGLLVWHVDETVTATNSANADPNKPLLALEQADGQANLLQSPSAPFSNRGDDGDPYPGSAQVLLFNHNTSPNTRYNNGRASLRSLEIQRDEAEAQWDCSDTFQLRYNDGHPYRAYLSNTRRAAPAGSPGLDAYSGAEIPVTAGLPEAAAAGSAGVNPRLVSPERLAAPSGAMIDNPRYLPMLFTGTQYATGVIRAGGAPLANTQVRLMYSTNDGDTFSAYGSSALTDKDGRYALRLPPLRTANTRYYIFWQNTDNNDKRLSRFECHPRKGADANHTCDFDVVNDLFLVTPAAGAAIDPPTLFQWTRRPVTSDSYALQLYKTDKSLWAFSDYLGYVDRLTLTGGMVSALPGGAATNLTYYWAVRASTPGGVRFSYELRPFTFSSLNAPPLNETFNGPFWHE